MSQQPKKRKQNAQSSSSSSDEAPPTKKKTALGKAVAGGFWKQGLLASMNDPTAKVFEDEQLIVIKDKYPKARHHFLVMPKQKIDGLHQLTGNHVELIGRMEERGQALASENGDLNQFRLGFHARASMNHLHMHVISQDFDSPFLKTKKHWNSFTTDFFRDVNDIVTELRTNGKIAPANAAACEAMLKEPLMCHICKDEKPIATIPKLKEHLKKHEKKNTPK